MKQLVNNYPRWILLIFVMFSVYIMYSRITTILYFFYSLVVFVALLTHILIAKNFNFTFNNRLYRSNKDLNIRIKLLVAQSISCLLANWWIVNTVEHAKLNIQTINVVTNVIIDNNYIIIIGIFVNWLVFISLLLGINFCKQRFNYPDSWSSIAKCLCKADTDKSLIYYKIIRHIEGNSKIAGLISVFIVATSVCYQLIINKYNLLNIFNYPAIVAVITMIVIAYFFNFIRYSTIIINKNITVDFIKLFIIMAVFMGVIIFIINQIILTKISLFPAITAINNNLLVRYFSNIIFNQNRIIILTLSINILLASWSVYVLLNQINQYEIKTIYGISLFWAVLLSLILPKLVVLLKDNTVNTIIISAILVILLTQYQNIYSIHELISPRFISSNYKKQSKIKTTFMLIVQKIIFVYFVFLGAYYIINWVLLTHILSIISILFLISLLMLLVKCVVFKNRPLKY